MTQLPAIVSDVYKAMPLTPSEALVADLCRHSFLTLWSEANPVARPGKELCDVIVTCSPDVILISVKEVIHKETEDEKTGWNRWRKKAVDDSVKQLYGAERFLERATRVVRPDGSPGVMLPPIAERRYHRVAVALGSRGQVPYHQGDFGRGYVHVLDEQAIRTVLQELDTITDFVDYLSAKEALSARNIVPLLEGQEEDLLAFYIHQGRCFPEGPDLIVIGENLWGTLVKKPEWRARKAADRESYVWDRLIETLRELNEPTPGSPEAAIDSLDGALRVMARESRFCRRMLAQGFNEFMRDAAAKKIRARIMPSLSNVYYVFLASARDEEREARRQELLLRCFVARGRLGEHGDTVVGLATERYQRGEGFSMDAVRFTKPEWRAEDQSASERIQVELGYFKTPRQTPVRGDEFPDIITAVGRSEPCPCGSGMKYKKCHGRIDR